MSLNCLLFINFMNLVHFIMKYIIRFFVALVILFMFAMNLIAIVALWDNIPITISIFWFIGTLIGFFISLNYYELIIVKAKELLMLLATDTIDYYKKGDIHE